MQTELTATQFPFRVSLMSLPSGHPLSCVPFQSAFRSQPTRTPQILPSGSLMEAVEGR